MVFRRLSPTGSNALCSVLQLNDFTLLLDAGWDVPFRPSDVALLEQVARNVDAVLLTQPTLRCCGALPYAFAHCGLAAPVYAFMALPDFAIASVSEAWDAIHAHWSMLQTESDLAHFANVIRAEHEDDDDSEDEDEQEGDAQNKEEKSDDDKDKTKAKKERQIRIPTVCSNNNNINEPCFSWH